jgi:hypothetical protein
MTGIRCCAPAVNGHAMAEPGNSAAHSHRFIENSERKAVRS